MRIDFLLQLDLEGLTAKLAFIDTLTPCNAEMYHEVSYNKTSHDIPNILRAKRNI